MESYSTNYLEFLHPGNSAALSLLLMCVCGVVFVRRPMCALAFICIQPYFLWAVHVSYGVTVYLAYLAVLIIIVSYGRRVFSIAIPSYGPILLLSMVLVFWSVMSPLIYPICHGLFAGYTASRVNSVGSLLPMLLIPRILTNKNDVGEFVRCSIGLLAVVNCIAFVCCLVLMASGRSIDLLPFTRILGVMPQALEAALLVISVAYVEATDRRPSWQLISLLLIGIFGLVIAESRTKMVAALCCTTYVVWPRLRRFAFLAMVTSATVTAVCLVLPGGIRSQAWRIIERQIQETMSGDIDVVTSGRSILYAQAYDSFLSSPWIGVGEGYAIAPYLHRGVEIRSAPHNYYIGVLAQQGLVGAGILAVIIVLVIRLMLRLNRVHVASPRDAVMVRCLNAVVCYGLLCMIFKASWGSTFWSLALLQVFCNVVARRSVLSPIQEIASRRVSQMPRFLLGSSWRKSCRPANR